MRKAQYDRLLKMRRMLLRWHTANARRFSWRSKIRAPYHVLLCETMGQQTQATRIEEYLKIFLEAFPTINALANAPQSSVIKLWQGLGYNRRAINLHKTAKRIVSDYNGILPAEYNELHSLPGIGPYTANAIMVFAFDCPVSAIDINVSRVITRISKKVIAHEELLPPEKVKRISNEILPIKSARSWHEALMDLGATICTKRNPKCSSCPLQKECPSRILELRSSKNAPSNRSKEPLYFGHPKRIWRGRVLNYITKNSSVEKKQLYQHLMEQFEISLPDSRMISAIVLRELSQEGFILKSNGKIGLE